MTGAPRDPPREKSDRGRGLVSLTTGLLAGGSASLGVLALTVGTFLVRECDPADHPTGTGYEEIYLAPFPMLGWLAIFVGAAAFGLAALLVVVALVVGRRRAPRTGAPLTDGQPTRADEDAPRS